MHGRIRARGVHPAVENGVSKTFFPTLVFVCNLVCACMYLGTPIYTADNMQ